SVPGYDLMDMPGVLWKKFEDRTTATNLAFIGSIKDNILDMEEIASTLLGEVKRLYPEKLMERYKLQKTQLEKSGYDLLAEIGRNRGMLIAGGEIDYERAAIMVVDEFRASKLGALSLESPCHE
ncbi:MAG: ribosome biogenesis GTPase YlqF, partial [Pygmaiobacter sp.]